MHRQCEREITDSESARKPRVCDLVLLFLLHIVWTSHLFWCTYVFVTSCDCVGTTCAYGCGCWYFACLLAMNANWARSSCLEQSARTSLLDPFSSSLHPSPPCTWAHTHKHAPSARKWHNQASWQKIKWQPLYRVKHQLGEHLKRQYVLYDILLHWLCWQKEYGLNKYVENVQHSGRKTDENKSSQEPGSGNASHF